MIPLKNERKYFYAVQVSSSNKYTTVNSSHQITICFLPNNLNSLILYNNFLKNCKSI